MKRDAIARHKSFVSILLALVSLASFSTWAGSKFTGQHPEAQGLCEIDLDGNSSKDLALLLRRTEDVELIVVLRRKQSKTSTALTLLSTTIERGRYLQLSCVEGGRLKQTRAGEGNSGSVITVPHRTYLRVGLPESSASAFYFIRGEFHRIWISD